MSKAFGRRYKRFKHVILHKDQFRERIRSGNRPKRHEVLRNAPNSQQPFIDSDSEKGQFEPPLRPKLSMTYFSACRKWRTQYNKTFIDSHSSRLYGAKLLRGIEGLTETHKTNSLKYIRPQTAYFPIIPTSFHSLAVVWIYACYVNSNISGFRPTNSQNKERYQFWTYIYCIMMHFVFYMNTK
jgi:hypothetical protein